MTHRKKLKRAAFLELNTRSEIRRELLWRLKANVRVKRATPAPRQTQPSDQRGGASLPAELLIPVCRQSTIHSLEYLHITPAATRDTSPFKITTSARGKQMREREEKGGGRSHESALKMCIIYSHGITGESSCFSFTEGLGNYFAVFPKWKPVFKKREDWTKLLSISS